MDDFPPSFLSEASAEKTDRTGEVAELMALARLLSFAQSRALDIDQDFVEYCVSMALDSINEELHLVGRSGRCH